MKILITTISLLSFISANAAHIETRREVIDKAITFMGECSTAKSAKDIFGHEIVQSTLNIKVCEKIKTYKVKVFKPKGVSWNYVEEVVEGSEEITNEQSPQTLKFSTLADPNVPSAELEEKVMNDCQEYKSIIEDNVTDDDC
jgi:hypothetical protein